MRRFRFRATAALDLRRTQEQVALGVVARVEAEFQAVRERRDETLAARQAAMTAQLETERLGTDGASIVWHRTWISQLAVTADRLGADMTARQEVVKNAQRAWFEARRKRRALERMRDRAWQRHRREEDRQERLELDELARLRFLTPELGGPTRDSEPDRPDRHDDAGRDGGRRPHAAD